MPDREKEGKVVIISGPSGVGKSTICKEVARRLNISRPGSRRDVYLSVSVTTRPRAKGEIHGRNYWFVSKQDFRELIDKGQLLEYAEVFGHLYGTPKDKVEEALNTGKTIILEIDVQGAKQIKAIYPEAVMIFILPPSAKVLAERISHRGREDTQKTQVRLGEASSEIAAAWQYYQHMVINEDLQQAIEDVIQIIKAVPLSRKSQNEKTTKKRQEK
jgi:guanylate kinase